MEETGDCDRPTMVLWHELAPVRHELDGVAANGEPVVDLHRHSLESKYLAGGGANPWRRAREK